MSILKKLNSKKHGGISIEISLSLIMSVIILMFVLSLFSSSIEKIAQASGLYNYFFNKSKETEMAKVAQTDTQNAAKTQVEVQLVADQGLYYYRDQSLATISKYKENPPKTEAEIEDLARAAAVAGIYNVLTADDSNYFYNSYKISIREYSDNGYVKVDNLKLSYSFDKKATDGNIYKLAKFILDTNNKFS